VRTGLTCGGFDPATNLYLNRAAFTDPAPLSFGTLRATFPTFVAVRTRREHLGVEVFPDPA